jgi:hypothetical protein
MAELTLHFEASPGTDLTAAASELQKHFAQVDGVESAVAKAQRFQSIGLPEVLAVIKVATTIAESTASFLSAIAAVNAAWQQAKLIFPGLRPPTVEVGLKKIPLDQVTTAHLEEIAADE